LLPIPPYELLSAAEGRIMRPTFVHVLTGLLLGTALAGLLNVPGRVVAHQESIPPVRSPQVAKPKKDIVVRLSPGVERSLVVKKAPPPKPRVVVREVVVRTFVPAPKLPAVEPSPPKPAARPKPAPASAPPPPPPPPKTVLSQAQSPSSDDDEEEEEDDEDDDDDDGGGEGDEGSDDGAEGDDDD
jgi:hypothetical protein